ncbi:MAG: DUF1353 domain-containing protein [Gammaproteobacteria bacterium]
MLTKDQMPKLRPLPVNKRGERRRWEVLEDWTCDFLGHGFRYIIPKGFIFDGASIPRLFWNILSPAGYLFMAGLVHDFVYKYRFLYTYSAIESLDGMERRVIREFYTQKEADCKFEALADKICMGAHFFTKTAYITLRLFGSTAWKEHRERQMLCLLEPKGYVSFRKRVA